MCLGNAPCWRSPDGKKEAHQIPAGVSVGMGQPPPLLTLTSTLCDPAKSASHMVLTKTEVKVTDSLF